MRTYLVNDDFEINALNLESAYEQLNEMSLIIVDIEDITDEDDGQPTELEEWLDFDPDC